MTIVKSPCSQGLRLDSHDARMAGIRNFKFLVAAGMHVQRISIIEKLPVQELSFLFKTTQQHEWRGTPRMVENERPSSRRDAASARPSF
jgi:hypothetical protein